MYSRYLRTRLYIKDMDEEEPYECVVLKCFKDGGHYWYRLKRVDNEAIVDIQVRSIEKIWHRTSKVVDLSKRKKRLRAV